MKASILLALTTVFWANPTAAVSITMVNGQVVASDGSGYTVQKDGDTTTVSDTNGNVLIKSINGNGNLHTRITGGTSFVSSDATAFGGPVDNGGHSFSNSFDDNSAAAAAAAAYASAQPPPTPSIQVPQPVSPPGPSEAELKRAILKALLEIVQDSKGKDATKA